MSNGASEILRRAAVEAAAKAERNRTDNEILTAQSKARRARDEMASELFGEIARLRDCLERSQVREQALSRYVDWANYSTHARQMVEFARLAHDYLTILPIDSPEAAIRRLNRNIDDNDNVGKYSAAIYEAASKGDAEEVASMLLTGLRTDVQFSLDVFRWIARHLTRYILNEPLPTLSPFSQSSVDPATVDGMPAGAESLAARAAEMEQSPSADPLDRLKPSDRKLYLLYAETVRVRRNELESDTVRAVHAYLKTNDGFDGIAPALSTMETAVSNGRKALGLSRNTRRIVPASRSIVHRGEIDTPNDDDHSRT